MVAGTDDLTPPSDSECFDLVMIDTNAGSCRGSRPHGVARDCFIPPKTRPRGRSRAFACGTSRVPMVARTRADRNCVAMRGVRSGRWLGDRFAAHFGR